MASSKNNLPSDSSWLHELAKNELNPEAANIFNSMNQFDPRQLIEESSIEVLENLRDHFSDYSRILNSYAETGSKFNEIKIYGITNTPADFMVFRNNVKLVFSNTAHGIINVAFNQHVRGDLAVDGTNLQKNISAAEAHKLTSQPRDLIAQIGPFLDVQWIFQGERVNFEQLAKFYFIEFVKISRLSKKESPNQILLKQIKSLLQEKGIDL